MNEESVRMRERDHTSVVVDSFAAYVSDGIDALLPYLHEDVVWEDDPEWPDAGVWHGRERVRRVLLERLESTSIVPEIEGLEERGDRVLVLFVWHALGEASGASVKLRPATIYEFRGDLVARLSFFLDRDRARREFEAEPA